MNVGGFPAHRMKEDRHAGHAGIFGKHALACSIPPHFSKAAPAFVLISSGNHGGGTRVFGNTMCRKSTRSKPVTFGGRFDFVGSSPRFNASFSEPSPTAAPTSPKIAADRAPVFKSITIAQSPFRVFNAGFGSRGKLLTKTT